MMGFNVCESVSDMTGLFRDKIL